MIFDVAVDCASDSGAHFCKRFLQTSFAALLDVYIVAFRRYTQRKEIEATSCFDPRSPALKTGTLTARPNERGWYGSSLDTYGTNTVSPLECLFGQWSINCPVL